MARIHPRHRQQELLVLVAAAMAADEAVGLAFEEVRIPLVRSAAPRMRSASTRLRARCPCCSMASHDLGLARDRRIPRRAPSGAALVAGRAGAARCGALDQRRDAFRLRALRSNMSMNCRGYFPGVGPHRGGRCRHRAHPAHLDRVPRARSGGQGPYPVRRLHGRRRHVRARGTCASRPTRCSSRPSAGNTPTRCSPCLRCRSGSRRPRPRPKSFPRSSRPPRLEAGTRP